MDRSVDVMIDWLWREEEGEVGELVPMTFEELPA